MQIDPYAWLGTVPLVVLMATAYFLPADRGLKRIWQDVAQIESGVWMRLGWADALRPSAQTQQLQTAVYWMAVGAIACGSWFSLQAYWSL